MNSITVAQKCIREIFADKRTVMMMLVMPVMVLTLIYLLFNGPSNQFEVGYVGTNNDVDMNVGTIDYQQFTSENEAINALTNDDIDGIIVFDNMKQEVSIPEDLQVITNKDNIDVNVPKYTIITAGDDPITDPSVVQTIIDTLDVNNEVLTTESLNDKYTMEDYLTIYLMEFVIFFFTFLIVGMSFLKERKNATLQRMLTYDISRLSIVSGYLIGFGLIAVFQTIIVQLYSIYVLGIYIVGNIGLSIITNIIFAFVAIALGSLISTLASTEFQVMQFIPIIILPQVIFSGILPYGTWYQNVSDIFPLTWAFKAQKNLLLLNDTNVLNYVIILIIYVVIFSVINLLILRKVRKI